MRYHSHLIKVSVVIMGCVVAFSFLGGYIVPHFVFCYVSGIVDHKKIGHTLDGNVVVATYTISVRLFNDDTINNFCRGTTFAYIVLKADWDKVQSSDTVRLKILPDLKAQLVSIAR